MSMKIKLFDDRRPGIYRPYNRPASNNRTMVSALVFFGSGLYLVALISNIK